VRVKWAVAKGQEEQLELAEPDKEEGNESPDAVQRNEEGEHEKKGKHRGERKEAAQARAGGGSSEARVKHGGGDRQGDGGDGVVHGVAKGLCARALWPVGCHYGLELSGGTGLDIYTPESVHCRAI